jgi:hypothetical protein
MQPFEATIALNEGGNSWCIKLRDPNTQTSFTCKDLETFEKAIQTLSANHPEFINEVTWACEKNVPPIMMDEVRFAMLEFEKKYQDLISQ